MDTLQVQDAYNNLLHARSLVDSADVSEHSISAPQLLHVSTNVAAHKKRFMFLCILCAFPIEEACLYIVHVITIMRSVTMIAHAYVRVGACVLNNGVNVAWFVVDSYWTK